MTITSDLENLSVRLPGVVVYVGDDDDDASDDDDDDDDDLTQVAMSCSLRTASRASSVVAASAPSTVLLGGLTDLRYACHVFYTTYSMASLQGLRRERAPSNFNPPGSLSLGEFSLPTQATHKFDILS